MRRNSRMNVTWKTLSNVVVLILLCRSLVTCYAQFGADYDDTPSAPPPPKEMENCNGIFITYSFNGRDKLYPHVKNASAQAWSFQSVMTVLNVGTVELKAWKVYVGFQYNELLVSADGAIVVEGDGFPYQVGKNGTVFAGYPMSDLKTAIETAGDYPSMQVQIMIKGTQFGLKKGNPMPKTIRLANEGYICPKARHTASYMDVCCVRDPKYKPKVVKTKFMPRQYGDLNMVYDVMQAYDNKYLAQVTIDNINPLGRLDRWNLTWEWMRNEFINTMKGAYTHKKDTSDCVYGPQGKYYADFDFSTVMSCNKKPIISDLPREKKDDEKVGKLPYCCRNGTILPTIMNETEARTIFQLEVFKLPPDMNRTALTPPQNWQITGLLNPTYKCGPPIRVDPTEFPDPSGLDTSTEAIASWQVTCNITRPKPKENKCCVSFSAYYADSVIPCNTCACGCQQPKSQCDANAQSLPLPPQALLVPFNDRANISQAWAHVKGFKLPKKSPCPDNCGVSINWHIDSDYRNGWTARMTLFNWQEDVFEDWFTAVQLKRTGAGFEKVYSFNGTLLPKTNNLIFMKGLPGLNFLMGEVNGTRPKDPRVPGKQQSVISFTKKALSDINIAKGDGFPTKVYFNGEECSLPTRLPQRSAGVYQATFNLLPAIFVAVLTFLLLSN
ncbi:OLC1v1022823C1 [Oldenlandia corymbosa var. corymbosa]|uniref:OLC1v1022823C1 n=1 Tax=Oldenlandia corymbosa var. corymbosa TaxID=529605 RepID=A0AAV1C2C2_OLDCO|nr:OLC1v1022823C1 [Oldenlandia corymbosa var. corymbosa]